MGGACFYLSWLFCSVLLQEQHHLTARILSYTITDSINPFQKDNFLIESFFYFRFYLDSFTGIHLLWDNSTGAHQSAPTPTLSQFLITFHDFPWWAKDCHHCCWESSSFMHEFVVSLPSKCYRTLLQKP